jgi:hypothetical protein
VGRIPAKRRSSKGFSALSTAVKAAESDCMRCPGGHSIPNHTEWGQCTPIACAAAGKKRAPSNKREKPEDRLAIAMDDESNHMHLAVARRDKWNDFLQIPKGLKADAAEKYIDDKLLELGVEAVAHLEKSVKFGSDSQKEWASAKILDAIGKGKKEASMAPISPIVILHGSAVVQPPWGDPPKTIQGQVIHAQLQERSPTKEAARIGSGGETSAISAGGVRAEQSKNKSP